MYTSPRPRYRVTPRAPFRNIQGPPILNEVRMRPYAPMRRELFYDQQAHEKLECQRIIAEANSILDQSTIDLEAIDETDEVNGDKDSNE